MRSTLLNSRGTFGQALGQAGDPDHDLGFGQGLVDAHEDVGYLLFRGDELLFLSETRTIRILRSQVNSAQFRSNVHSLLGLGRWISIDGKLPALVSSRVPVDGSGVTQPVSAATVPLPTGLTVNSTRLLVDGGGVTQPTSVAARTPTTASISSSHTVPGTLPELSAR